MRGHGKAPRSTLIWGRSPAREDGGVDRLRGKNSWTEFPPLAPPPFALLELGSCRPCKRHCPPGGAGKKGREPAGRDTRLGSLHPRLPATAALQIGAEPASPEPALGGSSRRLAGRGRDVPFPPWLFREMHAWPKKTHLKGAGVLCTFLNALSFRVYVHLRK